MATVVSHAMRRFASTPDANYSCNLRSENPRVTSESSLSRSMRYAESWLCESSRASNGLLLTPALILCSCSDYINGTKRSNKKGPITCKKCKGTRIPFSNGESKFGTMRCYPTATLAQTPTRAGTVRVTSTSRPSILPTADPYDLMRRSRLTVGDNGSHFRARSTSPNKARNLKLTTPTKYSTVGRKSILECDVNPYELMDMEPPDSSITLVNGQRIRVRPRISEPDYEDIPTKKSPPKKLNKTKIKVSTPVAKQSNEKENESNRFKSILKKPTSTFSDTDTSYDHERSPSPSYYKSGSHFYIPMPNNTPRKKVQFLVENELVSLGQNNANDETSSDSDKEHIYDGTDVSTCTPKLRRSESERGIKEQTNKVVFHDSMALRTLQTRPDSRIIFTEKDLEKLDGIVNSKLSRPRPKDPPPQPPILKEDDIKIENRKEEIETPPSAPPRKRSNNKQPVIINNTTEEDSNHKLDIYEPIQIDVKKDYEKIKFDYDKISIKTDYQDLDNKTILQINSDVHKLKIRNEFPEPNNVNTISILDNSLGKTSIMINGDDCYSTIKVCDEIPLYHSSVVVKDCGVVIENGKSSSVYITGNFVNSFEADQKENYSENKVIIQENTKEAPVEEVVLRDKNLTNIDLLKCLSDPVEAVKRNLVPHVCGKSDPPRRPRNKKKTELITDIQPPLSDEDKVAKFIEESFLKLRNNNILELDDKDISSEHSSSTQYEIMDHGSDCYTDHSNRSSITEEELNARTKFYELLADSAIVEVSESEDHHYESIKVNSDPIYEEIEIPPPLPSNPPPSSLLDDLQLDKEYTTRSIFEGASKYDILSYLVDAKERGIVPEDSYTYNFGNTDVVIEEEGKDNNELPYNRVSHLSTVSDSSEDSSLVMQCSLTDDKSQRTVEVERNDSGVGSETSKSSLSKYRTKPDVVNTLCEDCESNLESHSEHEPLICRKCMKKRTERKEIIMEIVETEEKYSRDLQIILEEFYQPMLVAGLLTSDQLAAIFLNVEELLENSQALAERLRDAVEIAIEQGDDDLLAVNIGKLFLEAAPMLHAFETYCVRQGAASLLLASLEKEKELLRIFLRVSQMENTVLRRMNLNSFLMVPVQRVTKYPLLLARLYKVTPAHHETREQLKESQHKIELHLSHMNSETKDVPSKLWRRISSIPGRRSSSEMDLVNIKLRKIAVDVLEWNHDEAKFALEGRLLFTQPTDNNWRKGRTIKLTPVNALLVTNGRSTSTRTDPTDESLVFSRQAGIRDAALLLVRDKNGRYTLLREPLYLDRCIIAADPAWQSYFEVQELLGKDTFIFKADDEEQTKIWYRQLQYYAQGMGAWRKRRNALANIMINGMGLRS